MSQTLRPQLITIFGDCMGLARSRSFIQVRLLHKSKAHMYDILLVHPRPRDIIALRCPKPTTSR